MDGHGAVFPKGHEEQSKQVLVLTDSMPSDDEMFTTHLHSGRHAHMGTENLVPDQTRYLMKTRFCFKEERGSDIRFDVTYSQQSETCLADFGRTEPTSGTMIR